MRNAISYCAMRVVISGSSTASSSIWFSFSQILQKSRRAALVEPRRIREVQHRIAHRPQLDALIPAREGSPLPHTRVRRLVAPLPVNHHDKCGQILVLAAQAISDPRTQAGPARDLEAGLQNVTAGS